jgi:hypothetical protein
MRIKGVEGSYVKLIDGRMKGREGYSRKDIMVGGRGQEGTGVFWGEGEENMRIFGRKSEVGE